jgi:hypothetical protein
VATEVKLNVNAQFQKASASGRRPSSAEFGRVGVTLEQGAAFAAAPFSGSVFS